MEFEEDALIDLSREIKLLETVGVDGNMIADVVWLGETLAKSTIPQEMLKRVMSQVADRVALESALASAKP